MLGVMDTGYLVVGALYTCGSTPYGFKILVFSYSGSAVMIRREVLINGLLFCATTNERV